MIKILVAGDYCPRYRVEDLLCQNDYDAVLGEIKEVVRNADYSIVNLECSVTIGGEKPIVKAGTNLFYAARKMVLKYSNGRDLIVYH